jgi:hypothetical protein
MSHLIMGIVNKDEPVRWALEKELHAPIADQIMAALYQLGREGKPAPAFEGMGPKDCHILVTCANQDAVEWLKATVEDIGRERGLQLAVVPEKEIPVLTTVKLPILTSDAEEALLLIKAQNPGLNTERWQVHVVVDLTKTASEKEKEQAEKETPKGNDLLAAKWLLVCSVDQEQLEVLRAKNFMVYVGMKRFRAHVPKTNREDGAGNPDKPAPQ